MKNSDRDYNFNSVRDLLRLIRNLVGHFEQMVDDECLNILTNTQKKSIEEKNMIRNDPEQQKIILANFFLGEKQYPNLFIALYNIFSKNLK